MEQQNQESSAAPPQTSTSPHSGLEVPGQPVQSQVPRPNPFYRSYWIFGAIYLILPPIIGIIILLTGDIYRKQKDGQIHPVHKREKIILTILAVLLWGFIIFSGISRFHNSSSSSMKSWLLTNQTAYNDSVIDLNTDFRALQSDTPDLNISNSQLVKSDCQKLQLDVETAQNLPSMPDEVAAGYFQDQLTNISKLANSCLEAVNAKAAKLPDASFQYLLQSQSAGQKKADRLKVLGIQ